MNKVLPILIVGAVIVIGGYFVLNSKKPASIITETGVQTKETSKNAFDSIRDAVTKAVSLKCEYPDPTDNTKKVTTFIKGGSVRVIASGKTGSNTLIKDGKIYNWIEGEKQGTVITLDVESLKETEEKMGPEKQNQKDSIINQMEQYKDYCKTASVTDSYFVVPTDVKFTDFAAQMKQETGFDPKDLMEKAKQYQQ